MTRKYYTRQSSMILLLMISPIIAGFSGSIQSISIWIVNADYGDRSVNIAIQTILTETNDQSVSFREVSLNRIGEIPKFADILILVGHGQPEGLELVEGVRPWDDVYNDIEECQPKNTIVLACNSPSDKASSIYGFDGLVDAEAGAILVSWYIRQQGSVSEFPLKRIAEAQSRMLNPLGRYLYFIHGYWGMDDEFYSMLTDFEDNRDVFQTSYDIDNVRFFDYYDAYDATTEMEKNQVHWSYTISDFATNLYNEIATIPSGSQVNIIGHSMGGIITREMLRLHRTNLDSAGIDIGRVITLGTPHLGTYLADPGNNWAAILALLGGLLTSGNLWPSPVFWSMDPMGGFINILNYNPMSYSSGIDWFTISGHDIIPSLALFFIHGARSDPIVAENRAHLTFSTTAFYDVGHNVLINDPSRTTYQTVADWISGGTDSDSDGFSDDSEIYWHGTDPFDSDTDNDGLSDYEEILVYDTDPCDWNTDNDAIGDNNEIMWGYDPLNANSPIPQSSLISSVSVVGRTVKVYVNHYSAMDYVKFYAKYRTKHGSWTNYYYMGTDYSPTTGGDYYDSWTHPTGYVRMTVKVNAFDSSGHYLGTDTYTCAISDGGGGGGPPIE